MSGCAATALLRAAAPITRLPSSVISIVFDNVDDVRQPGRSLDAFAHQIERLVPPPNNRPPSSVAVSMASSIDAARR